jgi:hypothetical protein
LNWDIQALLGSGSDSLSQSRCDIYVTKCILSWHPYATIIVVLRYLQLTVVTRLMADLNFEDPWKVCAFKIPRGVWGLEGRVHFDISDTETEGSLFAR